MKIHTLTDADISRIVNKASSTIARWKKDNPALYEAVYRGCLAMKYGSK